ncbi:hypothetical protein M011DRAFT_469034 [Sporormia fimetaria CBS 119925]|uniref:Uncharacterized protein n=1 Tax=Sporormia fimetaria CBS 119925 TaxID=1340428 RepID=A0A6A6V8F6_9PLEO|nr:hypothetical protein M011DRAFT_469034 [Sporormia fimetaria CBS 119925]
MATPAPQSPGPSPPSSTEPHPDIPIITTEPASQRTPTFTPLDISPPTSPPLGAKRPLEHVSPSSSHHGACSGDEHTSSHSFRMGSSPQDIFTNKGVMDRETRSHPPGHDHYMDDSCPPSFLYSGTHTHPYPYSGAQTQTCSPPYVPPSSQYPSFSHSYSHFHPHTHTHHSHPHPHHPSAPDLDFEPSESLLQTLHFAESLEGIQAGLSTMMQGLKGVEMGITNLVVLFQKVEELYRVDVERMGWGEEDGDRDFGLIGGERGRRGERERDRERERDGGWIQRRSRSKLGLE